MKKQELTQERLKELLHYDPDTGILTWKYRSYLTGKTTTWNIRFANKQAGHKSHGYIAIQVDGIRYQAHRLAWLYIYGLWPVDQIDHVDNVRHHNWIINLREANNSENNQNLKKAQKNNLSTGLIGSYYDKSKNKYLSSITINKKQLYLGRFNTAQEAHERYLEEKEGFTRTIQFNLIN